MNPSRPPPEPPAAAEPGGARRRRQYPHGFQGPQAPTPGRPRTAVPSPSPIRQPVHNASSLSHGSPSESRGSLTRSPQALRRPGAWRLRRAVYSMPVSSPSASRRLPSDSDGCPSCRAPDCRRVHPSRMVRNRAGRLLPGFRVMMTHGRPGLLVARPRPPGPLYRSRRAISSLRILDPCLNRCKPARRREALTGLRCARRQRSSRS